MLSKLKEILSLIELSKKKRSGPDWIDLGRLTKSEIDRYYSASKIDLSGYKRVFTMNELQKIINKHGPKSNDKYKIDYEDFLLIPFILSNPDSVVLSKSLSESYRLRVIKSNKFIGDNYVIIEEIRQGRKSLAILSMYKQNAKRS